MGRKGRVCAPPQSGRSSATATERSLIPQHPALESHVAPRHAPRQPQWFNNAPPVPLLLGGHLGLLLSTTGTALRQALLVGLAGLVDFGIDQVHQIGHNLMIDGGLTDHVGDL